MFPDSHAAFAAGEARLVFDMAALSPNVSAFATDTSNDGPQKLVICRSSAEAASFRDRYGSPSYELVHAAESKTLLVFQLEGDSHPYNRLEHLTLSVTSAHPEDQTHPRAGFNGWVLAPGYSSDKFTQFSLEDLEAKFGVAYTETGEPHSTESPGGEGRIIVPFPEREGLTVHGEVYDDQLATDIEIAFGRNSHEKNWPNKAMKLGSFIMGLTNHQIGPKDGHCFITGKTLGNKRARTATERMHLMGLDIDNGTVLAATIERIKAAGLFAVVYTTHSHMKAVTDVSQTKFYNWCKKAGIQPNTDDLDQIKAYLAEVRRYTPEIVASVMAVEEKMDEGGIKLSVSHAPIPKFRIMLPLAETWNFQQKNLSQQDTIRSWGRKIFGVANSLSLTIDTACVDPSRLFYGPRHVEGRPFEVHVIGGDKLDIHAVAEAEHVDQSDPFAAAGREMAGGDRDDSNRYTASGLDLWKWNKERGLGFEAADAVRASAPAELIRYFNESERKLIVKCPFDDQHSNPGDEDDVACLVMNASDCDDRGFFFKCQHESCKPLGRADMICKAIEMGYVEESALTEDTYSSLYDALPPSTVGAYQSGDVSANPSAVDKLIGRLEHHSGPLAIEQAIGALVRVKPTKLQTSLTLNQIAKRTGCDLKELRRIVSSAERDLRAEQRKHGCPPRTDNGLLKIYPAEQGYPEALADAKSELLLTNNGPKDDRNRKPRLFNFGNRLVRAAPGVDGRLKITPLTPHMTVHELNRVARFIGIKRDGETELPPPRNIADLIPVDDEADFPLLKRVAGTPFYDSEARLISVPGYHWPSGTYYDPPCSFDLPTIPDNPTSEEAAAARDFVLQNVFVDFPFDDGNGSSDASRAHALALLLLSFVRQLIPGHTPVHFITKPAPGTGASLLVDAILAIQTGDAGMPHVQKEDVAEERKALTARLMTGATYFWLDNINEEMDSAVYALALTTGVWSDRVLGCSDEVTLPITWSWIFSGNNVDVSKELSRRLAPIRLDAKGNPLKRDHFRHADLPGWVLENRPALVAACLTMIEYWISKGRPMMASKQPLRSYEAWSRTMGGLLEALGVPGFLGNLHLAEESVMDADSAFESLIAAWFKLPNCDKPRAIVTIDYRGRHSLVDLMEENEIDMGFKAYDESAKVKALSKALDKRKGRAVTFEDDDGRHVEVILRMRPNRTKTREFWLEKVET